MLSLIAGFWNQVFDKPSLHILVIGLDHAGKTTILEKIKSKFSSSPGLPPGKIPPTVGMNLAKIQLRGSRVIFWDLGGQKKMRSMWERYYAEANAVIFVVDSADVGRLEEAKLSFDSVCDNDWLSDVPVITIANKQDLPGALTPGDLAINFYSVNDAADRTRVFAVNAILGEGIDDCILAVVDEAMINARSRAR